MSKDCRAGILSRAAALVRQGRMYRWLLVCCALSLLAACEQRPLPNTPQYLQAHGIVPGSNNSIRVGDTLFDIPASVPLEVFTEGEIEKGKADTLTLYLDFASLLPHAPDTGVLSPASVRVEIKNLPGTVELPRLESAPGREWSSIAERPDLGLTEFRAKRFDGGWGYLSYQATAPDARTPAGGPIQFACRGLPDTGPDMCWGGFRLNAGTTVWYFLSNDLLPHWRHVHHTIINTLHTYERT